MRYRVIHPFADLHDKKYKYEAGDLFPRQGLDVSEDRLKELSGTSNKAGIPLIEEIEEEPIEPIEEEPIEEEPIEEEPIEEKPKNKTSKRKK